MNIPRAKPARHPEQDAASQKPRRRDAGQSRKRILQAALEEFSAHGHSGARIERIAAAAGVSKPLLYDYFGDKDAIYAAALREAYEQIREAECALDLESLAPVEALRALVQFTMNHYREKPWFISMVNGENLLGGTTIRQLDYARGARSPMIGQLGGILRRGSDEGLFRPNVDPVELYIFIASLCYFPLSNMHTLRDNFGVAIDDEWLDRHVEQISAMLLLWLR